ncbi:MAG: acyltransferase family protein [Oscillospiraceae bacterium]|nr:acyltransferase family protein [Oscillospiraceae bacterium]
MTKRQSNFELLRIVAMLMIVFFHFSVHGENAFISDNVSFNEVWANILGFGGKLGVNIFVFISGYFMIESENTKPSKVINMWLQLFFYSVVCFIAAIIFFPQGEYELGMKSIIKAAFPVSYSSWWFATQYIILYIFSPYLNKLLKQLNKREYINFLAIATVILSILAFILPESIYNDSDFATFIYLYSIAGYIKLWSEKDNNAGIKMPLIVFVISLTVTILSVICLSLLGNYVSFAREHPHYFIKSCSPNIIICSVSLFLLFKRMNIPQNKLINTISKTTFGIYLIHDNDYIRHILWKYIFNNSEYLDKNYFIIYSLVVPIIIFAVCSVIELIRDILFSKVNIKFSKWLESVVIKVKERLLSIVLKDNV